jgi:serine/threonine protein kinase
MGVVYRARDRETNELVALKVLKPEIAAQSRLVERFKQELRLAHKITHKNVCRTHELHRFGDTIVIAMEYVAGETLRAVLNRSSGVLMRRALQWTEQICAGLEEAHSQGVVHRDLKPENIFVDNKGEIKVMDFGIARSLDADPTSIEGPIGTPAYMSPEQAQGRPSDTRSDIYSLGLVMYEMFIGRRAFQGDAPLVLLSKQINEIPPSPREVEPYLPDFIDATIMRCLAKDPEYRFQSVHEVRASLTNASIRSPRPTMQLSSLGRVVMPFAASAVALFFLVKWVTIQPSPSYQRVTFRHGTISSARFHPNGTIVYGATMETGNPRLFQTWPGRPESQSLDLGPYKALDVMSISGDGRMLVIDKDSTLLEAPFIGGAPHKLRRDVEWADWAPDGIACGLVYDVSGKDRLDLFRVCADAGRGPGRPLYETTGEIGDARFSPKENLIAFLEHPIQDDPRGWVAVVDLNGNKRTLSSEYLNVHGLAWSPGGEEIFFTAARAGHARALFAVTPSGKERLVLKAPGSLWVHDVSAQRQTLVEMANERRLIEGVLPNDAKERDLSWLDYSTAEDLSEDGNDLLFDEEGEGGGAKHAVYLRRGKDASPERLGDGIAAALSPDRQWALSIIDTPPRKLVLLSTSGRGSRDLPRGSIETFISGQFFPDGNRILLNGSEPRHGLRCYVQDLAGGVPIPKTPEGTYYCLISPDAKLIVAKRLKEKATFYRAADGRPIPIPGIESNDEAIRFDNHGQHLYVYDEDDAYTKVYRVDTTTGARELWKQIRVPDPLVDSLNSILLTPDGRCYVSTYQRTISDLYVVDGLR